MAYAHLDLTKPNTTQDITQFSQSSRDNFKAIRDFVVSGAIVGWAYSWSGGTADKPLIMLNTNGSEIIKAAVTWGTTGGAKDNATQVIYSYSSDAGSNYDVIGTETLSYDASGNLTSTVWS